MEQIFEGWGRIGGKGLVFKDSMVGWEERLQVVAGNMQSHDRAVWIFQAFVIENGGSGHVKKPDTLLHASTVDPGSPQPSLEWEERRMLSQSLPQSAITFTWGVTHVRYIYLCTEMVPIHDTVGTEGEHAVSRKRSNARPRTRRTRRHVHPAQTSTASENFIGKELAIRSPHCETETLARLETVVEEGSHVQPTVDTVKRAVKVEVTWAENVKVEPVEAGGDSRSSIICIPPTMEEQLMRRIVAGKDELLSAKAMLARHKSVEEELYMSYRVWDLRSERLRKEHELELAITSHFVVTKGDVGNESHHAIRELIAEVRMIEASRKVHGSYSALRAKRAEVLNQERAIKTLARVLEGWESKFDERVQDLLGELQKGGDYDRAA